MKFSGVGSRQYILSAFLLLVRQARQAGKDITSAFSPIADSHLTCGNLASSQTHRCNPDQGQCQWYLFEEEIVSRGSADSRKIEGARVETCQTHSSTPDWVRAAQLASCQSGSGFEDNIVLLDLWVKVQGVNSELVTDNQKRSKGREEIGNIK